MIKLQGLSEKQVAEISRRIADAFFDYDPTLALSHPIMSL